MADDASSDHARVIQYEHVTRTQNRRQFTEHAVLERVAVDNEQSRAVARAGMLLRDQFRRKVVIIGGG